MIATESRADTAVEPYSAQDACATGIAARVTVAVELIRHGRLTDAERLLVGLREILPPPLKAQVEQARRMAEGSERASNGGGR